MSKEARPYDSIFEKFVGCENWESLDQTDHWQMIRLFCAYSYGRSKDVDLRIISDSEGFFVMIGQTIGQDHVGILLRSGPPTFFMISPFMLDTCFIGPVIPTDEVQDGASPDGSSLQVSQYRYYDRFPSATNLVILTPDDTARLLAWEKAFAHALSSSTTAEAKNKYYFLRKHNLCQDKVVVNPTRLPNHRETELKLGEFEEKITAFKEHLGPILTREFGRGFADRLWALAGKDKGYWTFPRHSLYHMLFFPEDKSFVSHLDKGSIFGLYDMANPPVGALYATSLDMYALRNKKYRKTWNIDETQHSSTSASIDDSCRGRLLAATSWDELAEEDYAQLYNFLHPISDRKTWQGPCARLCGFDGFMGRRIGAILFPKQEGSKIAGLLLSATRPPCLAVFHKTIFWGSIVGVGEAESEGNLKKPECFPRPNLNQEVPLTVDQVNENKAFFQEKLKTTSDMYLFSDRLLPLLATNESAFGKQPSDLVGSSLCNWALAYEGGRRLDGYIDHITPEMVSDDIVVRCGCYVRASHDSIPGAFSSVVARDEWIPDYLESLKILLVGELGDDFASKIIEQVQQQPVLICSNRNAVEIDTGRYYEDLRILFAGGLGEDFASSYMELFKKELVRGDSKQKATGSAEDDESIDYSIKCSLGNDVASKYFERLKQQEAKKGFLLKPKERDVIVNQKWPPKKKE